MRKLMTKEVTMTIIKLAKMNPTPEGITTETLPDEMLLGSVSLSKCQKHINKKYKNHLINIYHTEVITKTYEMEVEEFIKIARIKGENEPENTEEYEDEDQEESNDISISIGSNHHDY